MPIERDGRGDYVLDATALAEALSIPPEDLRRRMRLGLVTSLVETGEGGGCGPASLDGALWRGGLARCR